MFPEFNISYIMPPFPYSSINTITRHSAKSVLNLFHFYTKLKIIERMVHEWDIYKKGF